MLTTGWVLIALGVLLMISGAVVEIRKQPAKTEAAAKNPIAEIIEAISALIKELSNLFKVLTDYTSGRFIMAMGLVSLVLGVVLVLVS